MKTEMNIPIACILTVDAVLYPLRSHWIKCLLLAGTKWIYSGKLSHEPSESCLARSGAACVGGEIHMCFHHHWSVVRYANYLYIIQYFLLEKPFAYLYTN